MSLVDGLGREEKGRHGGGSNKDWYQERWSKWLLDWVFATFHTKQMTDGREPKSENLRTVGERAVVCPCLGVDTFNNRIVNELLCVWMASRDKSRINCDDS
jgi:hypothetical protein